MKRTLYRQNFTYLIELQLGTSFISILASNVFLDRNKNCKLMLNFYGIGSAYWMSPEVVKDFKNCVKKSDIW